MIYANILLYLQNQFQPVTDFNSVSWSAITGETPANGMLIN